jgi:peptidoglycan/xylan/chitin deacetylase (PgdA/CDA1 family)
MKPRLLRASGRRAVARLARLLAPGGDAHGLRILTYHRVNDHHPQDRLTVHPAAFREQMEALAAVGRPVLALGDALPALRGAAPLPRGAIALTFDDGYADNFSDALPILDRLGFKATFFVATGYLGTANTLERYRACCARDGMLDWDQVRELRARRHEVGGHGRAHRELGALSPGEAAAELEGCAADIASHTGERPRLFCYPRGSESPLVRELAAAHGFEAACTVYPGTNPPGGPLLALRRTEVAAADAIADFRFKLEGGYDSWHRLVQRAAAVRTRLRRRTA